MHEFSITAQIIKVALKEAEKHHAKRINKIKLKVGVVSAIVPNCVEFYFNELKKDTIAADAKLEWELVPLIIRCPRCKTEIVFDIENNKKINSQLLSCDCNQGVELVQGNDIFIDYIDVE
jgi:hydrogenase nickel incorporation protein HypA/HybF